MAGHDAVALVADQAADEPDVPPVVVLDDELPARRFGLGGLADLAASFGARIQELKRVAVEPVNVVVGAELGSLDSTAQVTELYNATDITEKLLCILVA
jgi:hypothetical protein